MCLVFDTGSWCHPYFGSPVLSVLAGKAGQHTLKLGNDCLYHKRGQQLHCPQEEIRRWANTSHIEYIFLDLIKTCYAPSYNITISFTVQRSLTVCLSLQCPIFSWGSLISPFPSCLQAELQKTLCALIVIRSCCRLPRVHSEDIFPLYSKAYRCPFLVSLSFIQAAAEDLPQGEKKWFSVDLDGGGLPARQTVKQADRQTEEDVCATTTDNLKGFERTLKMRQTLSIKA